LKKRFALVAIIITMLFSGLSLAEDTSSSLETETSIDLLAEDAGQNPEASPSLENETTPDLATTEDAAEILSLEGSWIFSLEDVQIFMVVHQSGEDLFGAAKSGDSEPWNAMVRGSISGDEVEMEILSIQNAALVSMNIMGAASDGMITGSFVRFDSNGNFAGGDVTITWISPDTSGYEPADVVMASAPVVEAASAIDTKVETETEKPAQNESKDDKYFAITAPKPRNMTSVEVFTTGHFAGPGMM